MALPATIADFKARFSRDFLYGPGFNVVRDDDINAAFVDATAIFNTQLFSGDDSKTAFLYASAHFVVTNINAAGGLADRPNGLGITNEAQDIIASRSVGGVNYSSVEPPAFVTKSEALRQFWHTDYGRRYLSMLQPRLVGVVGVVVGPRPADIESPSTVPYAENS